jgi:hypothetical protein
MRFSCHREQCRRKDRPYNSFGIFVINPPVFGHSGSSETGKKQMIFEYGQLPRLNEIVFKWVRSGRMTDKEFQAYMNMISEPMSPLEVKEEKKAPLMLHLNAA